MKMDEFIDVEGKHSLSTLQLRRLQRVGQFFCRSHASNQKNDALEVIQILTF